MRSSRCLRLLNDFVFGCLQKLSFFSANQYETEMWWNNKWIWLVETVSLFHAISWGIKHFYRSIKISLLRMYLVFLSLPFMFYYLKLVIFAATTYIFFKKNFGGHKSFLLGHWYPCFGLLLTSPPGFKARVSSLIHTWLRSMWYMFPEIHPWCDTFSDVYGHHSSWSLSPHVCFSIGRLLDLNRRPPT